MATIDTASIEGFSEMSDTDKVNALLGLDIPEKIDLSGYVKKDLYDKTASELAAAKKSAKDKMSADEQAAAEAAQRQTELEEKYNELLKKSTIAEHTARYMALPGFDEKLARETAEALYDGDMDKVFANQQKASDTYAKQVKAEVVKQDPHPGGNGGSGGEEKSASQKLAEQIGKSSAAVNKSAQSILAMYTNGGKS